MSTRPYSRRAGLRTAVTAACLTALLSLAPAAWAADGKAPDAVPRAVPVPLSSLGDWMDGLLSGMERLWEAAGCRMDPDGSPCADDKTPIGTQDGETCEPMTTEQGCGMDPNG